MTPLLLTSVCLFVPSADPPPARWPIDAKTRAEIDRLARACPPLSLKETRATIAGAVPGFLLTALDLPSTEEHRRAELARGELLKRERALATPPAAAKLLDRLVKELPTYQLPEEFRYALTVLDRPEPGAVTPGGGFVVVTRGLLDQLLADRERGEAALAFVLAREIGHSALGHCRRGWQRVLLEEDARKEINGGVPPGAWRDLLETNVAVAGQRVEFMFSLNQEYRADLFGLHLCRNAGFDLDRVLDGMRYLATRPGAGQPLNRLKRLLQERDGEADPEAEFGLFSWDRTRGGFVKCRPGDLPKGARPIVFVHGMFGNGESWNAYLTHFSSHKSVEGRPLLVFRHPGNGSLARSGLMLFKQVQGVIDSPEQATFVCHSAGGLAFRWYAEKLGGRFDRAVILATPHLGSDLTALKFLADVQAYFGTLKFGLNDGAERLVAEGRGEIGRDLHPDSLFLRALGKDRAAARRYHVFYGEWLQPARARLLETGFLALGKALEDRLVKGMPEGLLRRQAERLAASLALPAEIVKGDCIVSIKSANLSGAGSSTKLKLRHLAFRTDPEAIRLTLEAITR